MMKNIKNTALIYALFLYCSTCYGDIFKINRIEQEILESDPEVLKNLSYDPPGQDLLSNEQNRKAWQTFVKTYETPVRKVQDWYNSIVDKKSADAAADSFNKDVLPILKKLTGCSADMKNRLLPFLLLLKCKSSYFYAFLNCKDGCSLSSCPCKMKKN